LHPRINRFAHRREREGLGDKIPGLRPPAPHRPLTVHVQLGPLGIILEQREDPPRKGARVPIKRSALEPRRIVLGGRC
jgi:hypothetical protein